MHPWHNIGQKKIESDGEGSLHVVMMWQENCPSANQFMVHGKFKCSTDGRYTKQSDTQWNVSRSAAVAHTAEVQSSHVFLLPFFLPFFTPPKRKKEMQGFISP